MNKFFHIDHGMDNYEEFVDISEVLYVKITYSYQNARHIYTTELTFKNGTIMVTKLTEKGYRKLLDIIKPIQKEIEPTPQPSEGTSRG